MVEFTLEALVKHIEQIGIEFSEVPKPLAEANLALTLQSVQKIFCNSDDFYYYRTLVYHNSWSSTVYPAFQDLCVIYAYYFINDYILRKTRQPQILNSDYIKCGISPKYLEESADSISDIYNRMRNQLKQFLRNNTAQEDPKHFNPYTAKQNVEKSLNTQDQTLFQRAHWGGDIIQYFNKIFSSSYYTQNSDYKINDLLPGITIATLNNTTIMPLGTHIKDGCLTINDIQKIVKQFNYAADNHSTETELKFPELLYSLVFEDLFKVNRLNITLTQYAHILSQLVEFSDKSKEQILLKSIFSVVFYMPSVYFQNINEPYTRQLCMNYLHNNPSSYYTLANTLFSYGSIIFPQMLVILLSSLCTNRQHQILPVSDLQKISEQIEGYIEKYWFRIKCHFPNCIPELGSSPNNNKTKIKMNSNYIWDNKSFFIRHSESKGKNHKPRIYYETIIPNNQIPFEEMTKLLFASEPRWRYCNIIEENLALSRTGQTISETYSISENLSCVLGNYLAVQYPSALYSMRLATALNNELHFDTTETESLNKFLTAFSNPFNLFKI